MSDVPATEGFRDFARRLGCRPSYVTQLRQAGRLVLTDDNRGVRVAESLARIEATRDPAKAGVVARHAAQRAEAAAAAATGAPGETDGDPAAWEDLGSGSHAQRRAKALADKAETDAATAQLDLRKRLGELWEASEVEQATRNAVATFRGALENLPATLAPELSAVTDEARAQVILASAIEYVLENLAREFSSIARAGEGA